MTDTKEICPIKGKNRPWAYLCSSLWASGGGLRFPHPALPGRVPLLGLLEQGRGLPTCSGYLELPGRRWLCALVTLEISSRLREDGTRGALRARALKSLEMTSFYRAGRRGEAFLQTLLEVLREKRGRAVWPSPWELTPLSSLELFSV